MRIPFFYIVCQALLVACIRPNPLIDNEYSTGSYKYSLIQHWTGTTYSSSIVDTIYLDSSGISLLEKGRDPEGYDIMGYESGQLTYVKSFSEFLIDYEDCNMKGGECHGRVLLYERDILSAQLCLWKPPGQQDSFRLYSEYPLNSEILGLPEDYRVWNVFDFELIN